MQRPDEPTTGSVFEVKTVGMADDALPPWVRRVEAAMHQIGANMLLCVALAREGDPREPQAIVGYAGAVRNGPGLGIAISELLQALCREAEDDAAAVRDRLHLQGVVLRQTLRVLASLLSQLGVTADECAKLLAAIPPLGDCTCSADDGEADAGAADVG